MSAEDVLGEIEDILRKMPRMEVLRGSNPENFALLGRIAAVLNRWNSIRATSVPLHISQLHQSTASSSHAGYSSLMTLLYEAREDLRMSTIGPVSSQFYLDRTVHDAKGSYGIKMDERGCVGRFERWWS